MISKKKIVLITTGQPSCNPRIVKEADCFSTAGYEVLVLYSFFINWAQEKDESLLKNVLWNYKMVGGNNEENKLLYFFTRLRFKISRILNRYIGNKLLVAERAEARAYDELLQEAKKIKADWYIGHNLGALSIAVRAAKHNNAKAGFDFEDYHRGEGHNKNTEERIIFLERKYVHYLFYYSTASELITKNTALNHIDFGGKVITLLNCFPQSQQPVLVKKSLTDKTIKLFWFSQTIGLNRGIELLMEALKILNNKSIQITLAGRCNDDIKEFINKNYDELNESIKYAGIIQPENLPAFASQFDVGMAIELDEPYNRNICLTNKIFTYLLAGNAMILSDTLMQTAFNDQFHVGEIYKGNDPKDLANKITLYLDTIKLNHQRKYNYQLAKNELNWEQESKKLLDIIN